MNFVSEVGFGNYYCCLKVAVGMSWKVKTGRPTMVEAGADPCLRGGGDGHHLHPCLAFAYLAKDPCNLDLCSRHLRYPCRAQNIAKHVHETKAVMFLPSHRFRFASYTNYERFYLHLVRPDEPSQQQKVLKELLQ
jgi:hypothetical protein